jgi:Tol biopolymer transport system component
MTGPESRLQLQHTRQVTFALGAETQPVWSPDGGRIAYTAAGDIWIVHAAGGPTLNLTQDHGGVDRDRSGNRDIWVVPSEGGPATQITDDPGSEMGPSWSPDGQNIAYYHADHVGGDSDGFVMPLTGGERRRILNGPSRYLQWSPDGEWIGFLSGLSTQRFARVAASGGTPEELPSDVRGIFRWSRDSKRIYFSRDRELWELTLATNAERRLTALSLNPGGLVSYTLAVGAAHLYFAWSHDTGDIWVMDVVAPEG